MAAFRECDHTCDAQPERTHEIASGPNATTTIGDSSGETEIAEQTTRQIAPSKANSSRPDQPGPSSVATVLVFVKLDICVSLEAGRISSEASR